MSSVMFNFFQNYQRYAVSCSIVSGFPEICSIMIHYFRIIKDMQ